MKCLRLLAILGAVALHLSLVPRSAFGQKAGAGRIVGQRNPSTIFSFPLLLVSMRRWQ
jgi:hypothetical protein